MPEVRVISSSGEQLGVFPTNTAKNMARAAGLDLVEISPKAHPPVTKIMDYGKYAYEMSVKQRAAKRNQVSNELKEVRFRLKIEENDLNTKLNQAIKFLENGDRVKISVQMKGREQAHPEVAIDLLANIAEKIADYGYVDDKPKKEGRNFSLIVLPNAKKVSSQSEQRRRGKQSKEERIARQNARLEAKKQQGNKKPQNQTEQKRKVFDFDADQI